MKGRLKMRQGATQAQKEISAPRVLQSLLEHLRYMGVLDYGEEGDLLVVEVEKPSYIKVSFWRNQVAERVATFGDSLEVTKP